MQHLFRDNSQAMYEFFADIKKPVLVSTISGLLIFYFLISAFYYGVNRNYHHIVPEAIEYQNVNLAIAITERVYKMDLGHVAHGSVYDALRENGVSFYKWFLEPLGTKFPDNASNPVLINRAFHEAANLGILPEPKKLITEQKPIEPNDVGMSEFYKVSFALFGLRVQSFYLFYFVVFGVSVALYFVRHLPCPFATAFLSVVVGLHFVMFVYVWEILPPEQRFAVGTVYAPRFISILAIVPAFHIAIDVVRWDRITVVRAATFICQAFLLAWLLTMRGTVLWGVLWIVVVIGALLALLLIARFSMRRAGPDFVLRKLKHVTSWPVIVFVLVTIGYSTYYKSNLNPIYRFGEEFLPTHMVWHSIYAGMEFHPEFRKRFAEDHSLNGEMRYGDAMPMAAAENYLKRKYDLDGGYITSSIYGLKYRTTERIIKEVYFEFIRNHPKFILELHLIYKPLVFYQAMRANFIDTLPKVPISAYIGLSLCVLLIAYASISYWRQSKHNILIISALIPLGFLISTSPMIVAFPSDSVIGDQFYMFLLTVALTLSVLPCFVARLYALLVK